MDQLMEIESETDFLAFFKRAIHSLIFLQNPIDFVERFHAALSHRKDRRLLTKAIPLLIRRLRDLESVEQWDPIVKTPPSNPLDHLRLLEGQFGEKEVPGTFEQRLRHLEVLAGFGLEKKPIKERLDRLANVAYAEWTTAHSVWTERGSRPDDALRTAGEELLDNAKWIDIFNAAEPSDRLLLTKEPKIHAHLAKLADGIDLHKDYVAPLIESSVGPSLSKASTSWSLERTQDPAHFDPVFAPILEAHLALQTKQPKTSREIFQALGHAHTLIKEGKIEPEAKLRASVWEVRGLAKVFSDNVESNLGKLGPVPIELASSQAQPFLLLERLKLSLQTVEILVQSLKGTKNIDPILSHLIGDVAHALRKLKMTPETGAMAKDLASAFPALIARASSETRQSIAVFLLDDLHEPASELPGNVFKEEIIRAILKTGVPEEARRIAGEFWGNSGKMKNENIFRFVLLATTDPSVYWKLSESSVEGRRNSLLQKAILHAVADTLNEDVGKSTLTPLQNEYKRRLQKGHSAVRNLIQEQVEPLILDSDLSLMALKGVEKRTEASNPYLRLNTPQLGAAERLGLLSQAAANGLVTVQSLPKWLKKDSGTRSTPTNKTEMEKNINLGLLATSLKNASGRRVKLKSGKEELFRLPPRFSEMRPEEKMQYALNEQPPLDLEAVRILREFFATSGIETQPYPTKYEPIEPLKPW
jgi:hypothetical protein